jgi:hypothetical protein
MRRPNYVVVAAVALNGRADNRTFQGVDGSEGG